MKKIIVFATIIIFPFISVSQIQNIWEKDIYQTIPTNYKYLNKINNTEYIIIDSTNGYFNIFQINTKDNRLNKISDSLFKIPTKIFHVATKAKGYIYSGSFGNQGSITYKTDSTSLYFTRSGIQNKSIFLKSYFEGNGQLISFGLTSLSDPNLNPYDSFDEILFYKFDTTLLLIDSLIIDLENGSNKSKFIDCISEPDLFTVLTFNEIDSNCTIVKDEIKKDFSSSQRKFIQVDTSNRFVISYSKVFHVNQSYFFINLLTNKKTGFTEISVGKLKNNNYSQLKRVKLPHRSDAILWTNNNPHNNFNTYYTNNEIAFSVSPFFLEGDSIVFYYKLDTLGNKISDASLNLKNHFKKLGYTYSPSNHILLDSTLLIQGFCSRINSNKTILFYFLLKDNFTPLVVLDSTNLDVKPTFIFPEPITNNEFLFLGSKYDQNGHNFKNYFFQKSLISNFTLSKTEIFASQYSSLIFPNPTSSQLNFTQLPQHLWVYSTTGSLVYQNQNPQPTLNLNLPNGMYFLQAQFEDGLKTQTLIIQQQ